MTAPRPDDRPILWLLLLALGAGALTVLSGSVAILVYTSHEPWLRSVGLTLQQLRPIHETCSFAWVFLGGVSVVYAYLLTTHGPLAEAVLRRLRWHVVLWAAAGVGILATILSGRLTGREYLGYPWWFSIVILAGWLLFVRNFFACQGANLHGQPAYIYMWTVGVPLFVVTYLEAHLYLLEPVSARPVRDIALQWKSYGVMVGSFNLLAYGALMWVSGRVKGTDSYARSNTAFALLFVGLLNTFTNYGHHTYHLPQTPWIHWISFSVSMLEVIILAKVFLDLLRLPRVSGESLPVPQLFMRLATFWSFLMLVQSVGISIPPLNTFIHGTHVVVSHSMGSMIGIDTMILLAAFGWIVQQVAGPTVKAVRGKGVLMAARFANVFLVVFWAAFLSRGLVSGWVRYAGPSAPDLSYVVWAFPQVALVAGVGLTLCLLHIFASWGIALLSAWPRTPRPA